MAKYTLHDVDPDVWGRADRRAAAGSWSIGDLIKQLLRDYADGKIEPSAPPPRPRPHGSAPRKNDGNDEFWTGGEPVYWDETNKKFKK